MKNCPKCHRFVDGLSCVCGYTEKTSAPASRSSWLCANEYMGQRCGKLGRFTYSTLGSSEWYCEDHFAPISTGKPDPHAAQHLREAVKRAARPVGEVVKELDEVPF